MLIFPSVVKLSSELSADKAVYFKAARINKQSNERGVSWDGAAETHSMHAALR